MPRFTIVELVVETHHVDAASAQEALDIWLQHGSDHPAVVSEVQISVEEREVYDEAGNPCEVVEP